ncbi:MAG: hypothetical protein QXK37_06495, partial [Candidatus Woesearchaeota archaeon]
QELLSENCELAEARVSSLSSELYALGKILTDPNAKEEIGEENYRMLQKRYHLSQIKTYLFFKKLKQRCNETSPIILYYYKPNDAKSKEQGIILDSLVADNKNLHVFAIEYNFSKELTFLERAYGIYDAPALVINYKDVRVGLTKKEDILKKV